MIQYNFCSQCGKQLGAVKGIPHCAHCGVTFYRDPKLCASILPIKDGKVLLGVRSRDPYKGAIDIIGGFVEVNELPEEAAIREAKEETGLDTKITSLLGMYTDRYGEDGNYTVSIHYIGEVVGGEMKAHDDIASLQWVPIKEVSLDQGFQNTKDGLRDLKKRYL